MIYSHSATSLPSLFAPIKYPIALKRNVYQSITPIRAQGFRDHEGSRSSKSIVDENLNVLKGRMEEIKVKEKLERCCKSDIYGWNHVAIANYETKYGSIIKRSELRSNRHPLMELLELATIIGGTLGLTFFSGTFFLCLVSLFMHLNESL